MSFFVGDTVLFKSEDQHGIITKLNSPYKVTVKTSDGFEVLVSILLNYINKLSKFFNPFN